MANQTDPTRAALEALYFSFGHKDTGNPANRKGNQAKTDIITHNQDVRDALTLARNVIYGKHSPAPWTAQQDCRSIKNTGIFDGNNPDPQGNQNAWGIYNQETRIAVMHETTAIMPQDEINANARLIAAAPELLDALERVTDFMHAALSDTIHDDADGLQHYEQIARAAIAKARGQ